jgi:hypothetical protein
VYGMDDVEVYIDQPEFVPRSLPSAGVVGYGRH